jgi:hypothetical protein
VEGSSNDHRENHTYGREEGEYGHDVEVERQNDSDGSCDFQDTDDANVSCGNVYGPFSPAIHDLFSGSKHFQEACRQKNKTQNSLK